MHKFKEKTLQRPCSSRTINRKLHEKKFNLDGSDDFQHYLPDKEISIRVISMPHNGAGSLMAWGAFSLNWKRELQVKEACQTSVLYIKNLYWAAPLTDGPYLCDYDWYFQQENVIHDAEGTKEFFLNRNIALFFTIPHALMTQIWQRISGDG